MGARTGGREQAPTHRYLEAGRFLNTFLETQGMPTDIENVRRKHVESLMIELLERWKPATVSNHYRALRQFFRWAAEEGEIRAAAGEHARADRAGGIAVGAYRRPAEGDSLSVRWLSFRARRDMVIIRLLIDTGARREGIAGLNVDDIDFQQTSWSW